MQLILIRNKINIKNRNNFFKKLKKIKCIKMAFGNKIVEAVFKAFEFLYFFDCKTIIYTNFFKSNKRPKVIDKIIRQLKKR